MAPTEAMLGVGRPQVARTKTRRGWSAAWGAAAAAEPRAASCGRRSAAPGCAGARAAIGRGEVTLGAAMQVVRAWTTLSNDAPSSGYASGAACVCDGV